jgi:hypothetical protein
VKILNKEERTGQESLYSESYVVDFRERRSDGTWKRVSKTYYSTKKGAHKQVAKRFERDFRFEKAVLDKVTYQ